MKMNANNRRDFLVGGLSMVAAAGATTLVKKELSAEPAETVKLLRPDGTLVEVQKSVIQKQLDDTLRATNEDVKNWMNTSRI